jgi:3-dehydroquinate synthase
LQRLERLLVKNHLPIRLKAKLGSAAVLAALSRDKKVLSGELRFVLPSKIGRVAVHKVPAALALGGLAYVQPGTGR